MQSRLDTIYMKKYDYSAADFGKIQIYFNNTKESIEPNTILLPPAKGGKLISGILYRCKNLYRTNWHENYMSFFIAQNCQKHESSLSIFLFPPTAT